jgi:peptide deformylase
MATQLDIITIPHPTLRQTASDVVVVDKKLLQFIANLQTTLDRKKKPAGVGLAAPQVDKLWRIFATKLPVHHQSDTPVLRAFINPTIVKKSLKQTFGEDPRDPDLEGCLSIPSLYGPVPRWQWVEIEYQVLQDGELINQSERFDEFAARVVQHEIDHLNGILFTDYALEYDLPLYRQTDSNKKMEEVDPTLIQGI